MHALERGGESFVVECKTVEVRQPAEAALNHTGTGKNHEATLGFREFGDLEADTVLIGGLRCVLARVALIDEGKLDVLASGFLRGFGHTGNLGTVLLVG